MVEDAENAVDRDLGHLNEMGGPVFKLTDWIRG